MSLLTSIFYRQSYNIISVISLNLIQYKNQSTNPQNQSLHNSITLASDCYNVKVTFIKCLCFCLSLFVGLSVSRISEKLHEILWNFLNGSALGQKKQSFGLFVMD